MEEIFNLSTKELWRERSTLNVIRSQTADAIFEALSLAEDRGQTEIAHKLTNVFNDLINYAVGREIIVNEALSQKINAE